MARRTALKASVFEGGGGSRLYPLAFDLDTPFGRCVAVGLGPAATADRARILASIHPKERVPCDQMRGARLVEFAGGRVAATLAHGRSAAAGWPTLRGAGGAPIGPCGTSVSISHSRTPRRRTRQ